MPHKWTDTLAPGTSYAAKFRELLINRLEHDFEVEDAVVEGVIEALLEVDSKQALDSELEPIFDDAHRAISDW